WFYFCVDYSGPSASTPRPADSATIDTLHPVIGITILDTIWVRHSAYPNPMDSYFPHCPCYDSLCTDSTGALLEFPYCGDKFIEWNTIDTTSIILSVNGAEYTLDSPGMSWFDDSLLLFDTGEAGLSFVDGDTVRVCLEEATDRVSQGYGPNHLGRHADWTHPDTPVSFCWEFYVNTTGIRETAKPCASGITSIHPNPFNSVVSIEYSTESETHVEIDIYDILGRKIANIENAHRPSGDYRAEWQAIDFPGGIYFVRARFDDGEIAKRIIYLK
ncbi:MAG: T9SS type A sorting domain-containing protein, partial [Victivallales bacterium]|nr:T9SS type A sorting domain-containing protein [Victivallales bacterium]